MDEAEFARLVKLLEDDAVAYEVAMSEQGWLNAVYKDRWIELPATLGANLAIWTYKPGDRRRARARPAADPLHHEEAVPGL